MPLQQGYNILGQYRQQVLARLEAASRRGAPQSEIRRLQAELRAMDRAAPAGMGGAGGVPTPPPPTPPPMPGVTPTPYPTGTRLPAFATPMARGQPAGPTLDPSTLWPGPTPRTPIAPPGGVPQTMLPSWALPTIGPGGKPGPSPYEATVNVAPWLSLLTPEQLREWLSQQAGGMTPYQQEQVRLAQERMAQQRLQDLMGLAAGRQPTWLQRGQLGLSQEKFQYQQQQDVLARQLAQQQMGIGQQQFAAQQEYQQQSLAQAWMIAQQQLIQSQRELAAAIGSQVAGIRAQTWAQGLPHELPTGTQFAPGMGPGGPASRLARMGGAQFTPMRIAPSPPPSPQELMTLVQQAMGRFAPS